MKKLLFLAVILFLVSSAFAMEIDYDYDYDVMVRGLDTPITMTMRVIDAEYGSYSVYTLSDLNIYPGSVFQINEDYFEKEFVMAARNAFDIEGKYSFTHTLNQKGIQKFDKKFIIDFVDLSDIIEIGSKSVDFETGEVVFYVENLEDVKIENVSVEFSSTLFDKKDFLTLEPKEKIEISAYADPKVLKKTRAGTYLITATFDTSLGKVDVSGSLFLGEKKGITATEDSSGFLVRSKTLTKVNVGNVVESVSSYATQDIFSRLFTTFSVEPTLIERDGFYVYYTWTEDKLSPSEVFTIKLKTSYYLPFLIVVILIGLGILLKRYSDAKVEVKKNVTHVKTKAGEFALRIQLSVKARRSVENAVLTDRVPAMVRIYNKFDEHNKPNKVDSKSRSLHWYVGDLKSGEVRVFSYIVYSKVGIVGKFVLPEAKVAYEKDSKKAKNVSNKVYFMSEQSDK